MPRTSISAFIIQARVALQRGLKDKNQQLTFVIGNQSADLDSLTSSLLYAYIRTFASQKKAYIPVTNIPARDVGLRPEFTAVLKHANLKPTDLITLDDLPGNNETFEKEALDRENVRWFLVDHNALDGALGQCFSGQISGIIDHHAVENKDCLNSPASDEESQPIIIETSGSCTSLVTNYLRPQWDEISKTPPEDNDTTNENGELWDAQVAQLALASILIDTTNLKNKDKVTEHDMKAVQYLEAKIQACPEIAKSFDRHQFFEDIHKAKQDVGLLPLRDILRKDYKKWQEGELVVGISSVVKPLAFLIGKANGNETGAAQDVSPLLHTAERYAKDQKLDILMIMTAFADHTGTFKRELFTLGLSLAGIAAVKRFEQVAMDELDLKALLLPGLEGSTDVEDKHSWRKAWQQGHTRYSRKQVAPLIRAAMKETSRQKL